MSTILVVDDTPFWRDVTADALRLKRHGVVTAGNGVDALKILQSQSVDLIILDVEMPQLQGLGFLEQIRRADKWKRLPVIMLTGDMHKGNILLAKKLGAVDYILKARFSPPELLDRVAKSLTPAAPANPASAAATVVATASPPAIVKKPPAMTRLQDRDTSLERVQKALEGRTLSGVVAQVIALAGSPRMDLANLIKLIGQDPILTVRVLTRANSAANASARGLVTSLDEAIRIVGCAAIRDIAASVAVFDAMPPAETDGFHPFRSWQHSQGTAVVCQHLAPPDLSGVAYLVGLCHDLGEILFRSHFGTDYRKVLEYCALQPEGCTLQDVERKMLGITHGELTDVIFKKLQLPETIGRPIAVFHESSSGALPVDSMARILMMGDAYATGILLATSGHSSVRPFTKAECRGTTGAEESPRPDDGAIRRDIYNLTATHARLPAENVREMTAPIYAQSTSKIFIVRDVTLSSFDPVTAALQSLAEATVGLAWPGAEELKNYDGVVVLSRSATAPELASKPTLLISGRKEDREGSPMISAMQWPIRLERLAEWVQSLQPK